MPRYNAGQIGWNNLIRDQLSYQTWLLLGAVLQSALVHFVRPPYSFIPAATGLGYISLMYILESIGFFARYTTPTVNVGRFVITPPQPNTGVCVFVLGFQSSHPLRLMAPGTREMQHHFNNIFKTAEEDPETSGFLGKHGPMLDTGGEGGNAMMNISYWSSAEKLKAWNKAAAHSEGMKWYYANKSKYPYIGIMHELYDCPAGNFENVYINFRSFGFRKTQFPVDGKLVPAEVKSGPKKG